LGDRLALDNAIARKVNLQNFTKAVVAEILRVYSSQEAALPVSSIFQ
jgi:hypothetical protein